MVVTRSPEQGQQRWRPWSGWRGLALALSTLTCVLAVLMLGLVAASYSRSRLSGGDTPTQRTVIYSGECKAASQANNLLHLAINTIASCILASSNFFMQILSAPTRRQVDKAHARGKWLEIGVQSYRNLFTLPWRNRVFWLLFGLSSLPLHLVFNSIIIQTRASTNSLFLLAGESFTRGGTASLPGVVNAVNSLRSDTDYETPFRELSRSLSGPDAAKKWDRLSYQECVTRYNTPGTVLTTYRHGVMVVQSTSAPSANNWTKTEVLTPTTVEWHDQDIVNKTNTLWMLTTLQGTDKRRFAAGDMNLAYEMDFYGWISGFDPSTGLITMKPERINPPYRSMQAQYCLSEKFEVPCRLEVENTLFAIVLAMCIFKGILCFLVLLFHGRKSGGLLTTTGDAIDSFITQPDPHTDGMCALSRQDLVPASKSRGGVSFSRLVMAREWKTPKRRAGRAVPISVWVFSGILIGLSLMAACVFFWMGLRNQPL